MNTESKKEDSALNKNYTAKTHYKGEVAKSYLLNRSSSLKWKTEQKIMNKIISNLPKGSWILDLPVGTGRLLPFYSEGNYPVYGMDISKDMLLESKESYKDMDNIKDFIEGNAEDIPLPDDSVDYVVCLRLLNLVPLQVVENIIKEFNRVSRKGIIVEVRVTESLSRLSLMQKMLTNPRTHFNRLIYPYYSRLKNILSTILGKREEEPAQGSETYFLHETIAFNRILSEEGLITKEVIEVDKGLDYKKRQYKPLIIASLTK